MWTSRAWNNTLSLSLFFFLLLKPFALHLIYFSWAKIGLILNMGLWLSQHASIWRVFSSLAGFIECSGLPLLVLPNLHLTLFPVLPTLNLYPLTSWTYITGRRNVSMTCPECWPILYFSMGGPGRGWGRCLPGGARVMLAFCGRLWFPPRMCPDHRFNLETSSLLTPQGSGVMPKEVTRKRQLEGKWSFKRISIFLLKEKKFLFNLGLEIGVMSTVG